MQIGNGLVDPSLATSGITNNGTLVYNVNSAQTPNYASGISGTGSLAVQGAGILTFSGSNTYSGGTLLNAGTLVLGSTNAIGTGTLTISGGSLDSGLPSLVNAGNNPQNWNGDFTFVGSNNLNLGSGTVALAAMTLGAQRNVTVNASTLTVGGAISGSGYGINLLGAGTLALAGSNTYSGTTTVAGAGTLDLLNQYALQNSTLASGGTGLVFDQSVSGNFTFGGLGGSANLALQDNGGNAVALTVGANNQNSTYSGVLSGAPGTPGFGSLTKIGTGTLTLSGSNTYSGTTSISQGTIRLAGGSLAGTTGVTVNSGATLAAIGSSGNTIAGLVSVTGPGARST